MIYLGKEQRTVVVAERVASGRLRLVFDCGHEVLTHVTGDSPDTGALKYVGETAACPGCE